MKIDSIKKKRILIIFMCAFITGIAVQNLFFSDNLNEAGIFSDYFIQKFKYMPIDNKRLFCYILGQRIPFILIIAVLGATLLGSPAMYLYTVWIGISMGIVLSGAAVKFGFLGILLCAVSSFPHYILYILSFVILFSKISRLSEECSYAGKQIYIEYVLGMITVFILFFAGMMLESYVNPIILKKMLKLF